MKALTLTQPWATLVILGAKRYETRSWRASYLGPLVITASKSFPANCRELCRLDPFAKYVPEPDHLPLGCALGQVRLTANVPTDLLMPAAEELAFGNFGPGRYAWLLESPVAWAPIPCKGALGLWECQEGDP